MVNSLAICLKVIENKNLEKIKNFINFWTEKIEMEVVDQTEYEYPKYILRNTLCNILAEQGKYQDCLKVCNFSIKEITSDLKIDRNKGSPPTDLKEKAKLLITAVLYKIDCFIYLKSGAIESCKELCRKSELIMEKHGLSEDEGLKKSLRNKMKVLQNLESTQRRRPSSELNSMSLTDRNTDRRKKNFVVKSKKNDNFLRANGKYKHKSPDFSFLRESHDLSPKLSALTGTNQDFKDSFRSPKNVFFASGLRNKNPRYANQPQTTCSVMLTPGNDKEGSFSFKTVKSILRKSTQGGTNTGGDIQEYRRKCTQEIDSLLLLGDQLRKELTTLQLPSSNNLSGFSKKPTDSEHFDDSNNSTSRDCDPCLKDDLDSEIKNRVDLIIKGQKEWEIQRKYLNEKLEKLERSFERQQEERANYQRNTTATGSGDGSYHSEVARFQPPQGPNSLRPIDEAKKPIVSTLTKTSIDNRLVESYRQKVDSQIINEFMRDSERNSDQSSLTKNLTDSQLFFSKWLFKCCENLDNPATAKERSSYSFMQMVEFADSQFYIVFCLKHGTGNKDGEIIMKLTHAEENNNDQDQETLYEVSLTTEELKILFGKLNPILVLPSGIPISALVHIDFILAQILTKFIHIEKTDLSFKFTIQSSPRSLLEEDLSVKVLGQEFSLSFLHLNETNFRLILKKITSSKDKAEEIVPIDLYLNEFATNLCFKSEKWSGNKEIVEKIVSKEKLSSEDCKNLREKFSLNHKAVWITPKEETRVSSSNCQEQNKFSFIQYCGGFREASD